MTWKSTFDAVREACPSALWPKGVQMARSGAVAGEEQDRDTWIFRVKSTGSAVAPTVHIYPDDAEWDCDCGSKFDACQHSAACVIAVSKVRGGAKALFQQKSRNGSVRYELARGENGLVLERFLLKPGKDPQHLSKSLTDMIAKKKELSFSPTHADLTVDRMLGHPLRKIIPFSRATKLLRALVGAEEVLLNGRTVRASSEEIFPEARVENSGNRAVQLVIEKPSDVSEVVAPGVLRCGYTLHPFGAEARFGKGWERLPFRRTYNPKDFPDLVSRVIPELEGYIDVAIKTRRLPKQREEMAPWIRFQIDFEGKGVDVMPLLVYGNPPAARIDAGRMVPLEGDLPVRDEPTERRLVQKLRDELNLVPGRKVHYPPSEAARKLSEFEAFESGRTFEQIESFRLHGEERIELVPNLQVDGDSFDLTFEVANPDGEEGVRPAEVASASAEAVVSAWREGLTVVPLSDGGFGNLPENWMAGHGHIVADLLSAKAQNEGHVPRAVLPVLGDLCNALDAPEPVEVSRLRSLLDQLPDAEALAQQASERAEGDTPGVTDTPEPICDDFVGELRDYQSAGVEWLRQRRHAELGAILADDMGLGKTVQALCAARGKTLVVCPRSVIHNWTREVEKFRPSLSVGLFHGPRRELTEADITLTTYATLRNDAERLTAIQWDTVILDEAQAIKNPDSQTARTAYRLQATFRLSLSGTPIENRLDELWSQMHFTNRGLLGGRKDFAERYERTVAAGDEESAARLRKRIRPFILRRLKKEVAKDLPPRTEAVLFCELNEEERTAYDAVRLASRKDVVEQLEGGEKNVLAALEALLRLRQAACHQALLPNRTAASSSKVEALLDALEDAVADGHRALVFSQWTGFLDLVEPHLNNADIPFARLDGKTRDRGAVVDSFQSEDGPPILLISLTAGGTGLNLTAADHVFLLDPWWNPAVEDQAADRAHRIGQDKPVMVYRLVAKDTVEERVLDLQQRKRRIAEAALTAKGIGTSAITRQDILELLQ